MMLVSSRREAILAQLLLMSACAAPGGALVFSSDGLSKGSAMPLAHITLVKGRPDAELKAIAQCVHASLVEAYDMDDRDRFQVINEVEPGRLIFSPDYAGGPRSDRFMMIGITSMPRQKEKKEAFYKTLVERLERDAKVRREDVFVYLSDHLALEDISFANGVSAAELAKRYGRER